MAKTQYYQGDEINILQRKVMVFIDHWVHTEKTPVPRQEVIKSFQKERVPRITIEGALTALLHKGYIRRGYSQSNKTCYVQLRNIYQSRS